MDGAVIPQKFRDLLFLKTGLTQVIFQQSGNFLIEDLLKQKLVEPEQICNPGPKKPGTKSSPVVHLLASFDFAKMTLSVVCVVDKKLKDNLIWYKKFEFNSLF